MNGQVDDYKFRGSEDDQNIASPLEASKYKKEPLYR